MKKYSLGIVVIVYLVLYYPPLININTLHLVGAFSWLYILFFIKSINKTFKINKILIFYFLFILITIYIYYISALNGNSYEITSSYLFWMVDIIPSSIVVIHQCLRRGYNFVNLLTLFIIVGNIQGLTALLAFIFPEIQSFFIERSVLSGSADVYIELQAHRMYGFASGLTFTTPIIQSILAVIALYLGVNKNLSFLLFIPLLVFSAVINARTSLVILLIGIILLVLSMLYKLNLRRLRNFLVTIAFVIAFLVFFLNVFEEISPRGYKWVETGWNEIVLFLQGEEVGYFAYVSNEERYKIPEGIASLTGKGIRPMVYNKYNYRTDVGWINDIWTGGILYTVIIYIFFLTVLWSIYRTKSDFLNINKFIALLLFGVFIASNFKGQIFANNAVITFLFYLCIFVYLRKKHISTNIT